MLNASGFWSKVDIQGVDDCWPWLGSLNNTGYGTVNWQGDVVTAHRLAAYLAGLVTSYWRPKDPTEPTHVLHRCDYRRCCNPNHFFLGTYRENQLDAYAKGRKVQPRGQHHANAKLSNTQAAAIRAAYKTGRFRQKDLAKQYGVTQTVISLVTRGKTYA